MSGGVGTSCVARTSPPFRQLMLLRSVKLVRSCLRLSVKMPAHVIRRPGRRLPASVPAPRSAADRGGRSPQRARREPRSGQRAGRRPLDRRPAHGRAFRPGGPPAGVTPPAPATGPHGPVPFGPPLRRRPCMTPLRQLALNRRRGRPRRRFCSRPVPGRRPLIRRPGTNRGSRSVRRGPGPLSPQRPGAAPSPSALRPAGRSRAGVLPSPAQGPAASRRGSGAGAACRPPGVSRAPCRFPVLRI